MCESKYARLRICGIRKFWCWTFTQHTSFYPTSYVTDMNYITHRRFFVHLYQPIHWYLRRILMFLSEQWAPISTLFACRASHTGLISKAVKTYFDRKAVKTRLKPVKTGLNRSKRGQNLKLRNMCQGLWKNPVRWIYISSSVYGLCIWIAENLFMCKKKMKCRPIIWTSVKWNFKALMHFNTKCHHSINALTVTWFI